MTARGKRGAALLATAATLVFANGCAASDSTEAAPSVEKPDLNVAVVPALDSAGFFVALYEGLFAEEGLHVNFIPATSSDRYRSPCPSRSRPSWRWTITRSALAQPTAWTSSGCSAWST